MFNEFETGMKEDLETLEPVDLTEDPESAVLEESETVETAENMRGAEAVELTPEESAVYQDCAAENIQQMLEQYAMDDEEVLAALEVRAGSTETQEDDGQTSLRIEGGKSCGSAGGCSGSTWCYGCGEAK